MLEEADVYLVSKDKAFFKNYKYEHGLAPNLCVEAKEAEKRQSNKLKPFSDFEGLLQDERKNVTRVLLDSESTEIEYERYDQGAT